MGAIDSGKPIIGIDLGSTNSCACVVLGDGPETIPTRSGKPLTSSAVTFNGDGTVSVGDEALANRALGDASTVTGSKRLLGVSRALADAAGGDIHENTLAGKVDEEAEIAIGGENRIMPEQAAAAILASLRADAEEFLGVPVTDAVITVPAQFNDLRRQAVVDAAEIAGLNAVRLVNEPTAAAVEYGWLAMRNGMGVPAGHQILVFDMGGGTLDVSLCRVNGASVETITTAGDGNLGGIDFDRAIAEIVRRRVIAGSGVDVSSDGEASRRLLLEARNCKEELTASESAKVVLPYAIRNRDGAWVNIEETITRTEFESTAAPLVEKALSVVDSALSSANRFVRFDGVVLVGGSCKMPMIARAVGEAAGIAPTEWVDKDLCVAQGAALIAESIRCDGRGEGLMLLRDITGMDYGQELVGAGMCPEIVTYIEAGTPIPCRRTMSTSNCGTEEGTVTVYQAPHLDPDPDAPGNVKIFEHRFSFPYAKPFTKEFVDVMSIDENGIMTIETHDGAVNGPLLVSEKINLQRGSDADGRLARAKDEGILLRR